MSKTHLEPQKSRTGGILEELLLLGHMGEAWLLDRVGPWLFFPSLLRRSVKHSARMFSCNHSCGPGLQLEKPASTPMLEGWPLGSEGRLFCTAKLPGGLGTALEPVGSLCCSFSSCWVCSHPAKSTQSGQLRAKFATARV